MEPHRLAVPFAGGFIYPTVTDVSEPVDLGDGRIQYTITACLFPVDDWHLIGYISEDGLQ